MKIVCLLCIIYNRLLFPPPGRFSVNVFQPPFQSGRTSPETPQCRGELPSMPAGSPDPHGPRDEAAGDGSAVGPGDPEPESPPHSHGDQAECAQASALHSGESDSLSSAQTAQTTDSGFSEAISSTSCCSLDPHAEKETSCEKAVRPEGTIFILFSV